MRIQVWELAVSAVVLFVAATYAITGEMLAAAGVVIASVLWTVARSRPLDARGVLAGHVLSAARRERLLVVALWFEAAVVLVFLAVSLLERWSTSVHGQIAVLALAALEISLVVHLKRHFETEQRWRVGADAEVHVGASLDQLTAEGWLVHHNWPRPRGGNVDHIVAGRAGVFAIETKGGAYRGRDYSQAVGGALAFREAAGVRYVTPVVCVVSSTEASRQLRSLHVVRQDELLDWLRRRPPAPTRLENVRRAFQARSG